MTDKEKAATDWANKRCPEQGPEFIVWCMCREDFLAGYDQGEAKANKWWASRMNRLDELTNEDSVEEKQILAELDARAKEVLK